MLMPVFEILYMPSRRFPFKLLDDLEGGTCQYCHLSTTASEGGLLKTNSLGGTSNSGTIPSLLRVVLVQLRLSNGNVNQENI